MGKQISFYMDENDENAFFDFIQNNGVVFWAKPHQDPEPTTKLPDKSESGWFKLYLYKECFGPMVYAEVTGGHKYINSTIAPVIDFSRTVILTDSKNINPGRLWLEMKYYDENGRLIVKDESINDWYNELFKWIKKNLKYIEICNSKEYVSESLIGMLKKYYSKDDLIEAEDYWKRKEYAKVKELLEKNIDCLSELQLKKLKFINRKIDSDIYH